jgi:hypothetical protein
VNLQKLQPLQRKKPGIPENNSVRCAPYCLAAAGGLDLPPPYYIGSARDRHNQHEAHQTYTGGRRPFCATIAVVGLKSSNRGQHRGAGTTRKCRRRPQHCFWSNTEQTIYMNISKKNRMRLPRTSPTTPEACPVKDIDDDPGDPGRGAAKFPWRGHLFERMRMPSTLVGSAELCGVAPWGAIFKPK